MKEKLMQLAKEANIDDIDTYEYWERGGSFIRYYEDNYSGGTEQLWIDDQGYLRQTFEDESPEQCGGWVVTNVFAHGKWFNVSHICDAFAYIVTPTSVVSISYDWSWGAHIYVNLDSSYVHGIDVTASNKSGRASCLFDGKRYEFPKEMLQRGTCTPESLRKIILSILGDKLEDYLRYKDHFRAKLSKIDENDHQYKFYSEDNSYRKTCAGSRYYLDDQDNICRVDTTKGISVWSHGKWNSHGAPLPEKMTYIVTREKVYFVKYGDWGKGPHVCMFADGHYHFAEITITPGSKIAIVTRNGTEMKVRVSSLVAQTWSKKVLRKIARKLILPDVTKR